VALPSLTDTEPVGVPAVLVTLTATAYATFTADGSGVSEVIATVGVALFTVCAVVPLAPP
jgi:hypothetical protein